MEQPASPWGALRIPASLRTHRAYQNLFHLTMPMQLLCCCLLVRNKKSSSVPPCSDAYFPYQLLDAENTAGRKTTSSAACLCMQTVLVAWGQLGCPLAVWDCRMDGMVCGRHARVPRELAQRRWSTLQGTHSPPIDSASCSLPSARARRLLEAAPAKAG